MDLNDDCWMLVLKQLKLKDQISAARAFKRFHDLLSSLWKRSYQEFSVHKHITGTTENFAFFIEIIHDTVQSMALGSLTTQNWEIVKLFTYPNLKDLSLVYSNIASDEHVLKMTEIFPNLRSFSPNTPEISGKHIEKWRYLEDLNLDHCEMTKFNNFQKILEEAPLKSVHLGIFYQCDWTSANAFKKFCNLEEISVSCEELTWFSDFSLFKNLKMLEFLDLADKDVICKLLRYIAEHKRNDLIELRVCMNFPINELLVKPCQNLEKITLRWRTNTDFIFISRNAPNLRKIILKEFKGLKENDIYLWLNSTELELISVENCKCEFQDLKLKVKDIVRRRKALLHFNFYGNEFAFYEPVTLTVEGESSLLKISNQKTADFFCSDGLQFR